MNEKLINKLLEKNQTDDLTFELLLDDKSIKLTNTQILKTKTPVKRPTNRGGVYFSDTTTYKIKASTDNLTILERLKNTMLGPNDKFEDLKVKVNDQLLICNLTNTMHNSMMIELHMNIKDVKINTCLLYTSPSPRD